MKLGELADRFQLECRGDADVEITGIASLPEAGAQHLTFFFNAGYRDALNASGAGAVVLRNEDAALTDKPCLIAARPRKAWAEIAGLFDTAPRSRPFMDGSAHVSELATLGRGVAVGPGAVIRAGAVVADGASIGAGCYLGEGSRTGAGSVLHPNVVVYHDVVIGEGAIVHANAVLGADGFGFEFDPDTNEYLKIPQVYGVRIGDRVEIGAGTTIDRGALNHTVLGDQCKLDNQVQVGHGVTIGDHTVISGCTAIAGSTRIGRYCLIGGAVGIVDNIEIADRVEITAMSLVSRSILKAGRYSSGTGLMPGAEWKRSIVGFRKLDDILKRLRKLESGR